MDRILAHTPTIVTPASAPYRYVLVERTHNVDHPMPGMWIQGDINEYVVWVETFREDNPSRHAGYHSGYYRTVYKHGDKEEIRTKFIQAMQIFEERFKQLMEYIQSGYARFTVQ